jgi:hypothetical protein
MGASSTWIQLQKAVLDGTMEAAIKDAVSTISPVRTAMIRRSQLLQSGVTGGDGPTLDEIHAEEKAAAAASSVEVDVLAAAEASAELAEVNVDTSGDAESDEESSEESTEDSAVEEVVEEPADEADEAPEADADDSPDYASMTVAELKGLLKEAGKPVSGKKADLIARLQE